MNIIGPALLEPTFHQLRYPAETSPTASSGLVRVRSLSGATVFITSRSAHAAAPRPSSSNAASDFRWVLMIVSRRLEVHVHGHGPRPEVRVVEPVDPGDRGGTRRATATPRLRVVAAVVGPRVQVAANQAHREPVQEPQPRERR